MNKKRVETQHIVVLYTKQHFTLRQISKLVGMSPGGVRKRLLAAGVTARDGEWIKTACGFCGSPLECHRSRVQNRYDSYCNRECYYASRENPGYKPWRHGSRLARAIVAQYFKLEPEYVVDHIDGNERNNNLDNLRVYASQSDHLMMHHGKGKVAALWTGSIDAAV